MQGVEVRVSIVGFAIDDPHIEGTLAALAEHGGGQYFAATDVGTLQPTIEVPDSDGFTVGDGNGEAMPVPPGRYTLAVKTCPPTTTVARGHSAPRTSPSTTGR